MDGSGLPVVGVRELNRDPRGVLDRVAGGEVLCVCRYGRPVALLQPLGGAVVQALPGTQDAVLWMGDGDRPPHVERLTDAERALLTACISRGRVVPNSEKASTPFSVLRDALHSLTLRGLARRCPRGTVLTGRGMLMREVLCGREGLDVDSDWPKPRVPAR